ncbi:hypothetical protein D3C81_428640 [compost metagenome]
MIPVDPLAMAVGYMILIFSEVFLWLLIACLVAFLIMGMRVRRLELWQSHGNATVETVSTHDLEGWKCEAGKVEFNFPFGAHFKFSEWSLKECMLAPGTRLGGIVWPGPVTVFSTERGWEARSEDTPVHLLGMELRWLRMRVTGPDGDVLMWDGYLNRAVDFGSVHYPQGTQVRSDQGNLRFSLPADMEALDRRTGKAHVPLPTST